MSNSRDLTPIPIEKRTWEVGNYFTFWVSVCFSIPSYMLASSLISGGMNWYQAVITILLANTIILLPMLINGHAGAKYGIAFPILARASFGIRGANIPALIRALIACGWFGIQAWIGALSLFNLIHLWVPGINNIPLIFPQWLGISTAEAACFVLFCALHMWFIFHGMDVIRRLILAASLVVPLGAGLLLIWAIYTAHGIGPIVDTPSKFATNAAFWHFFFPGLTAMIGFWSTLSLNIPDFTRFAKSQKAHILGQAFSLPTAMAFFAFISVIITSATIVIYHTPIWNPIILINKFTNKWIVSGAMLVIILASLVNNVASSLVSAANDLAHMFPKILSFKRGGLVTGLVGILMLPWKLVADPSGYIYIWLTSASSLFGAIAGIMITDYLYVKRGRLDEYSLYSEVGDYSFNNGVNYKAVWVLILAIIPAIPGFMVDAHLVTKGVFPALLTVLYGYSWFLSFALAIGLYYLLNRRN